MEKTFVKGLVSICIPTYNGARDIKHCIDAVLAQDYKDIEIIVNDDCSKDNTLEVVRAIDDPRIKIYKNETNQGLVGNWNATLKYASGEFAKLLCQDDILCDGAISKQVEMLQANPKSHLCIGNSYVINDSEEIIMDRKRFGKDQYIDGKKYALKSFRGRNIYAEPPNALYYTKDFYELGEYDTSLSYTPDWDYTLRLSYLGPISVTSKYIFKFRVSSTSETSRIYAEKMKNANLDTDALLNKHVALGQIKISKLQQLWFKLIIRLFAVARLIVLKK